MDFPDRFTKARLDLIKRFPFWGQLSMYLELIEAPNDPECPTTQVDAQGRFRYNPEWVEMLNHQDLMFEIGHELGHLFTRTMERRPPGADDALWNKASDICIDSMLRSTDLIPSWVSKEEVSDEIIKKYDGMTSLQIYLDLLQHKKDDGGGGKGDGSTDGPRKCKGGCGVDKASKKETSEWKKRAIAAAQAAKSVGSVPGILQDLIQELLDPKVDWRDVLRVKVNTHMRQKWTWRYPSRRGASMGITLPGKHPKLPTAAVAIDTSGSISDKQLQYFISECAEILRLTGGRMRVILFDYGVYWDGDVEDFEKDVTKFQRGGTDFHSVLTHIEEDVEHDQPNMLVFFTDLYAGYPTEAPGYPVVWALTPDHNTDPVHFGDTVVVEMEADDGWY